MTLRGRCHCGNLSFTLEWTPSPTEIPARACTCSFCTRIGAVWTACPTGALVIAVRDAARLSRYAFGTRTADFHVCRACGGVPVVTSAIDGRLYAVVNVNSFDGVDPALIRRAPVTFDDESADARLDRRRRHWIRDVTYA
ncbi:MAG TPA: hypothetical protein VF334_21440 [Polyangia bacterium]